MREAWGARQRLSVHRGKFRAAGEENARGMLDSSFLERANSIAWRAGRGSECGSGHQSGRGRSGRHCDLPIWAAWGYRPDGPGRAEIRMDRAGNGADGRLGYAAALWAAVV